MFRLSTCIFMAVTALAGFAGAAEPQSKDAASLEGHYYLEGGPTEVGSELLVKRTGDFAWSLAYGADDYDVKGKWQLADGRVVLVPESSPEPAFKLYRQEDYPADETPDPGLWIAVVGISQEQPVSDVEVRFEARSGKVVGAVSDLDGLATVSMPAGEVWSRAGLRRGGSKAEWQWFAITPERAAKRSAGFLLTNAGALRHSPFSSMRLRVEPAGLVIEEGIGSLRGTYARH